jgi:hypothetical protein
MTKFRITRSLIFTVIFVSVFLCSRLPFLSRDEINPDGVNWHYRMQQFVVGLKTGQLEKTYQHYHPGVTLMWIAGIPVEIYKQVTGINNYDMNNFHSFHLVAKVSVVVAQLFLSLLAVLLLARITGVDKAFIIIGLLSLEPFFLGNSRLFHMDTLFALFLFNALLLSYLALEKASKKYVLMAGVFLSLSFLTKSIGIGALLYVFLYGSFYLVVLKKVRFIKSYLVILLGAFIVSLFLFFPALFKGPVYYLSQIFTESERVGVRDGHGQIILGEYTREAGPSFYPLVLLMKVSPFMVLGSVLYFLFFLSGMRKPWVFKRTILTDFTLYLFVFYLAYFLVMTFPTKKIDRYMIPVYPLLSYFAVFGYLKLITVLPKIKKFVLAVIASLFIFFVLYPDIKILPFLFTYTSPFFGTSESANRVIAQKPFGIGIFDLKDLIIKNYGNQARLGFLDVKPIEAIYANSKVFDMRVTGPGDYDYAILGINEVFPDKVSEDARFTFRKEFSLYINGLEYWRVYAKKTN